MQLLEGKVAVVTGGGRGIGLGITQKLLAAGAHVLVVQRHPPDAAFGANSNVAFVSADLAHPEAPEQIARASEERFDGIDIVVNNAGFMFERDLDTMTEQEWDQMMAVNLRAPAFLVKSLLAQMRRRGGGSVINIGSIEGIAANPAHTAYCASKAGLHGLTRAMAIDLGRDGIRCNALAPGWIQSDLSQNYLDAQADPTASYQALLRMHPVNRLGTPQDIGDAVVFLASDTASFLTGQIIVVDGGRTAKLPLPF